MSFTAFADSALKEIPDFESLVAEGSLDKLNFGKHLTTGEGRLSFKKHYLVTNQTNCQALILSSSEEDLVAIAVCGEDDDYFVCPGAPSECEPPFNTKKRKFSLIEHVKDGWRGDDSRFRVDFYPEKLVYRTQDESCFIPYPHGCLIDGFGWDDRNAYTFTPNSANKK